MLNKKQKGVFLVLILRVDVSFKKIENITLVHVPNTNKYSNE